MIRQFMLGAVATGCIASAAFAATAMSSAPANSWTVSNYYKQSVYSADQSKIGDIDDVLVDASGKITGLVVGVGGFLGMDSKDVIVPFSDVTLTKKDSKQWLTMSGTKDELKSAQGFTYNRQTTAWEPAKSAS